MTINVNLENILIANIQLSAINDDIHSSDFLKTLDHLKLLK